MMASDVARMDHPLIWATENLQLIGEGESASVFAHPSDAGLAIRISEEEDMFWWFAHCILSPEEAFASIHAPVVHDLSVGSGTYVGIVERLEPLRKQDLRIVHRVQRGDVPSAGLAELLETCPVPTSDLRDENWMMRGDVLVLIDPCARLMPEWMWERFEQLYGIAADHSPAAAVGC